MRTLILASALALSGAALAPAPAHADCLKDAIASCDKDFPPSSKELIAIRGWCYIIRGGMCALTDE